MNNLEISSSPTKLTKGNKRLTKVPLIIGIAITILILLGLTYALIARKQASMQKATEEKDTAAKVSTNDTDVNKYVQSLEESKNGILVVKPTTINNANKITPTPKIDTPQNIEQKPVPVLKTQRNEYDEQEIRLKKEMKLKALTSVTKLGIKTDQISSEQNKQVPAYNQVLTNNKTNVDGYLGHQKQRPLSKFEIKAGWSIPATLITGINSELPGQILAQVRENVYDTISGKYLLIPQGTKAVGTYSNAIIYGQSRLLVAWTKLIFPNGDTLDIENMQGADSAGYTGFHDVVDNHYFKIFGSALLLSSITAGISLADNSPENAERETAKDKAISAAIEQMGQVASEMIRKNMNVAPTLIVRPGYKFNIFVTKDMILEPLEIKR